MVKWAPLEQRIQAEKDEYLILKAELAAMVEHGRLLERDIERLEKEWEEYKEQEAKEKKTRSSNSKKEKR
jgi:hypothetical protein